MVEYGIHYDPIFHRWLFVIEDNRGNFLTRVFENNKIIYEERNLKYSCSLSNLCFYNNTLFIPKDGAIRGYNFLKNVFKDFNCSIVSEDSKLIREDKKFIAINEKEIYQIG